MWRISLILFSILVLTVAVANSHELMFNARHSHAKASKIDSWGYPRLPNDTVCNGYGCYKQSHTDTSYRYKVPTYRDDYGSYYAGNDRNVKQTVRSDYRRGLSNYRVYNDPVSGPTTSFGYTGP